MFINIKTYRDISEAGSAWSISSESSLKDRVALLWAGGSSFAFDLRFGLWATGICQKQSANQVLIFTIIHISSKQSKLGLTQEFSRISESPTGHTFTLYVIFYFPWHRHQIERTIGF